MAWISMNLRYGEARAESQRAESVNKVFGGDWIACYHSHLYEGGMCIVYYHVYVEACCNTSGFCAHRPSWLYNLRKGLWSESEPRRAFHFLRIEVAAFCTTTTNEFLFALTSTPGWLRRQAWACRAINDVGYDGQLAWQLFFSFWLMSLLVVLVCTFLYLKAYRAQILIRLTFYIVPQFTKGHIELAYQVMRLKVRS